MTEETGEEEVQQLARKLKSTTTQWGVPAVIASTSQSFFGGAILQVISRFDFWFGLSLGVVIGVILTGFILSIRRTANSSVSTASISRSNLLVGLAVFGVASLFVILVDLIAGKMVAGIVAITILVFILIIRGIAESLAINLIASGLVQSVNFSREELEEIKK